MSQKDIQRPGRRRVATRAGFILTEVAPCLMWILLEAELVITCFATWTSLFWGISIHEISRFKELFCTTFYSQFSFKFFGSLATAGGSEQYRRFLHHLRNMKTVSLDRVKLKTPLQCPFRILDFLKSARLVLVPRPFLDYILVFSVISLISYMRVMNTDHCHLCPLPLLSTLPPPNRFPSHVPVCLFGFVTWYDQPGPSVWPCVWRQLEPVGLSSGHTTKKGDSVSKNLPIAKSSEVKDRALKPLPPSWLMVDRGGLVWVQCRWLQLIAVWV